MSRVPNSRTSVAMLLGATVHRAEGGAFGRVREFAVAPLVDATRVEGLVVQGTESGRKDGLSYVPVTALRMNAAGLLEIAAGTKIGPMPGYDDFLMLERDLLDRQIIDVNGHKVVRVNDVDLVWEPAEGGDGAAGAVLLRIAEVEVGTRGAMRRLFKGLPVRTVERMARRWRPQAIPWEFVDLIDRDPARRVRLKIEQEKLAKMHPSDLADILEELAPAEREALFSSLDEEVAAEALEEVEPRMQKKLLDGLDSERIAGILEEMDPGAAADLLSELPEERSDAILEEMDEAERQEVEELLEYEPDTAAGLMTTDYVAVTEGSTVKAARAALRAFEGDLDAVMELFVVGERGELRAVVPLAKLVLAAEEGTVNELHDGHAVSAALGASGKKVAELFDKYNLRSLPVVDGHHRLAGVIRPEHVIGWLRSK